MDADTVAEGLQEFGFAGLDPNTPRVSLTSYIALFEWFASKLANPYLGIQVSQDSGPATLGAVGYMFLGSRNLEMAIRNLGNYLSAVQDSSQIYLGLDGDYAFIHYEILDGRITHRRQDSEYSLGYIWHLVSLFSGNSVKLTMVEFEHDRPAGIDEPYRRIFGVPTLFGRRFNRLHFRSEQLALGSQSGDPHLFPILEAQLRHEVANSTQVTTFCEQVQRQLTPDKLGDRPRAKRIAARLGMSETTLHRRLKAEGTSFKAMFDTAAKSHAKYLIAQKTLQVGAIARRLGYAETACLTRAFYRWFGKSPSEYRRSLLM
jgi:AraC-like DNA-binding protein